MEERVKDVEKVEHKVENEDEMSKNKTDNHRKRKIQKKKSIYMIYVKKSSPTQSN